MDSFGLELDGVELLPEASEEPLDACVQGLVAALTRLCRADRFAQLSLPESHLEVVFERLEREVTLRVVSLARPARLVRPSLQVGLSDLRAAAVSCAQSWKLSAPLHALEKAPFTPLARPWGDEGFGYARFTPTGGVGFKLEDATDALRSYQRRHGACLGPLLFPGELCVSLEGAQPPVKTPTLFLAVLEMVRQATEVARASEHGERYQRVAWGGLLPAVRLDLRRGGHPGKAVARALFEAGLALVFALTHRNPALAQNPYVFELTSQCQNGLGQLRDVAPFLGVELTPAVARPGTARQKPLRSAGKLRRLSFSNLWTEQSSTDESAGCLLLGPRGASVISRTGMKLFSPTGALLSDREGPLGVQALPNGNALCLYPDRRVGFHGTGTGARWLRPHDGGAAESGELCAAAGLWLVVLEGKTLTGVDSRTGQELWRHSPPRARRCHVAVHGKRAVITTDCGLVHGLNLQDGQVGYRSQAPLTYEKPAVFWERGVVCLGDGGSYGLLSMLDATRGRLVWSESLPIQGPSSLWVQGKTLYVGGISGGTPLLYAFDALGKQLFRRMLPLTAGPLHLLGDRSGLVAWSESDTCVKLSLKGAVEWRLGARPDGVPVCVPPVLERSVLFLPGEVVRAVDFRSGRLLAEVAVGPGLCGLKADSRLNLYTLLDTGALRAHQLVTRLSVVSGG